MKVTYKEQDKTYTVEGLPATTAHLLIWGGSDDEVRNATNDFRDALVAAEDHQMSDATYKELFN